MKLVRESIEFTRGGDSRKAIGIGSEIIIRNFFNSIPIPEERGNIGDLIHKIENGIAYFDTSLAVPIDSIYEFPKELKGIVVNGRLDLSMNPFKRLPDTVKVSKWLSLMWTKIERLPKDLHVKGSIYLSYSNIESIDNLKDIGGILDISNTSISRLPNNLKINGAIHLDNSAVSDLPEKIYIGGDLHIKGTVLRDRYLNNEVNLKRDGIIIGGTIYSE